jgi:hypothetical protein
VLPDRRLRRRGRCAARGAGLLPPARRSPGCCSSRTAPRRPSRWWRPRSSSSSDAAATIEWGARARAALAERLDDTEARVYALTNVGAAQLQRDDPDGLPTLERALALARQVLRKLDVASRGEAAAKALRLGLTT